MIYLDSSALVKKYLEEKGTGRIKSLLKDADAVATSKLAYPELISAFVRKQRDRAISETELHQALVGFEGDLEAMLIIDLQDELFPFIKRTLKKYHLKGADSVHLASALWLEQGAKEDVLFVASDLNLLKAAKAERLEVLNPQEE